ncbi:MAG: hypothetical protein KDK04_19675 [Candidatus Competibacteraceae bacterium]|nr:hypothetical protein [Candidatus Competibacteraceae bacterium]
MNMGDLSPPPPDEKSRTKTAAARGYIDDPDGAKSTALGEALKVLLQDGIPKKRLTISAFLEPHVEAIAALKKQGATYEEIAQGISEKTGLAISVNAVSAVLAKHGKRRRKKPAKSRTDAEAS